MTTNPATTTPDPEAWGLLESILDDTEHTLIAAAAASHALTFDARAAEMFPAGTYSQWLKSLGLDELAKRTQTQLPTQTTAGRHWRGALSFARMIDSRDLLDTVETAVPQLVARADELDDPHNPRRDRRRGLRLPDGHWWDPNLLWGYSWPPLRWIETDTDRAADTSLRVAIAAATADWHVLLVTESPAVYRHRVDHIPAIEILDGDDIDPDSYPRLWSSQTPVVVVVDTTNLSKLDDWTYAARGGRHAHSSYLFIGPLTTRTSGIPTGLLPTHAEFVDIFASNAFAGPTLQALIPE